MLALAVLPLPACAIDIPQIDPDAASIETRPSAYLHENTGGMIWRAQGKDGMYAVTARTYINGIADLAAYGFSKTFTEIVKTEFPHAGSYMDPKSNIGL